MFRSSLGGFIFRPLLILVFAVSVLTGCGEYESTEELRPVFNAEELNVEPVEVTFGARTVIETVRVKPTKVRRLIREIIGWIPIVRKVVEIPMDLVNFLIPPIPVKDILKLPEDADFADPEVAELIEHIGLRSMTLYVTKRRIPEEDLETCYQNPACKKESMNFLKEFRVYLIDLKDIEESKKLGKKPSPPVLIAQGKRPNKSKKLSGLILKGVPGIDLTPFLQDPERYRIRTLAHGRPPRRKVYVSGFIDILVKMRVPLGAESEEL